MAGAAGLRGLHAFEQWIVGDIGRRLAYGNVPQLFAGIHVVGRQAHQQWLVHRQTLDIGQELAAHARRPGGDRRARGRRMSFASAPGFFRVARQAAFLVDAVGRLHEARRAARAPVRGVHDSRGRVGYGRVVDVQAADAADVVAIFVLVGPGQRRHVKPPNPELREDLPRLLAQFRRIVDDELFGDAVDDDAVERLGPGRVWLGRGGVIAGHLGLENRAILDRPDRLAGGAIEGEYQPLFRVLDQRRNFFSVDDQIEQDRRGGNVVVPLVAAVNLEMPAALAGGGVERQHAAAEQVVARPVPGIGLYGGSIGDDVDQAEFRVGGGGRPGRHVAGPLPGVVFPGFVAVFAGTRNDVEFPQPLARTKVIAHDVAGHVFDARLVVARFVSHEHHGHAIDDDGRRGSGDHAEFARNAVVGIVDAALELPVYPALPVVHQRRNQVDDAGFGEIRQSGRGAPVFQRPAGSGVKRPEEEGRGGVKNHAAAVEFGPGDALAEIGARRTQIAHGFRFAKGP